MTMRSIIIALLLALATFAQEMDTTFFVNEQGQTFGVVHEKGSLPVMPTQQQLSAYLQTQSAAQPQSALSPAQNASALGVDSTDYYQSLIDRYTESGKSFRKSGGGMVLGGGICFGIGALAFLMTDQNWRSQDDAFNDVVEFSSVFMLIGGAAVFTAGFVLKGVGSAKLRRARRFQDRLDHYKMKQGYTLKMQVLPLIDPVNGQFGGMMAMNF